MPPLLQTVRTFSSLHKNGGLFFGTTTECDEDDAGVQRIGSDVTNVTPGQLLRAHRPGVVTLALEDLALVGVVENRTSEDLNWLP